MVELSYQALPLGPYLAFVALAVLLFGFTAVSRPLFGLTCIIVTLPLQKTAGMDGFIARFALVDVFTLLALLGTAIALIRDREPDWSWIRVSTQFVIGLAAFFVFVGASFVVTETPSRSIVETTAYVVNVLFLALILFHVRTRDRLLRLMKAWELAVVVVNGVAVIGLVLLVQGNLDTYLTNGPKLTATFKKSGQLSAYIMVAFPILWFQLAYRSPTRRLRVLRGLNYTMALVTLFATGSRSGLVIGLAVTAALFAGRWAVGLVTGRVSLKIAVAALVCLILVPLGHVAYNNVPYAFQRALSIFFAGDLDSIEALSPTRHYQWVGFQTAAAEYPLTGVGVGDFRTRNTALAPGAWHAHEIHNTYLGVWAETGVLGIAALFVVFLAFAQTGAQILGHARDPEMRAIATALLVALVTLYAYGVSHFGLRMRHLWMTFGLIAAAWNVLWWETRRLPGMLQDYSLGPRRAP